MIENLCMKKLSAEQQQTALRELPSLLDTLAFVYYFGGALAGPQVSTFANPELFRIVIVRICT